MTRIEYRVVGGGAALSCLFALGLHAYAGHFPQTLPEAAYHGSRIEVRLAPQVCDGMMTHNEFNCDFPYVGHRVFAKNVWSFSGRKANSNVIEGNDASNAPHEEDTLSLWGVLMKFDNKGRLNYRGNPAGTVHLMRDDEP